MATHGDKMAALENKAITRKHVLPRGLIAYDLCCNGQSFFVHFGFNPVTLVICSTCLSGHQVNGCSMEEVALKMYNHYCNYREATDVTPAHPRECRPSIGNIEQELKKFITKCGVSAKPFDVIVPMHEFENALSVNLSVLRDVTCKVCCNCFMQYSTHCCAGNWRIVQGKKRLTGYGRVILVSTEAVVGPSGSVWIPPPPPLPTPVVHPLSSPALSFGPSFGSHYTTGSTALARDLSTVTPNHGLALHKREAIPVTNRKILCVSEDDEDERASVADFECRTKFVEQVAEGGLNREQKMTQNKTPPMEQRILHFAARSKSYSVDKRRTLARLCNFDGSQQEEGIAHKLAKMFLACVEAASKTLTDYHLSTIDHMPFFGVECVVGSKEAESAAFHILPQNIIDRRALDLACMLVIIRRRQLLGSDALENAFQQVLHQLQQYQQLDAVNLHKTIGPVATCLDMFFSDRTAHSLEKMLESFAFVLGTNKRNKDDNVVEVDIESMVDIIKPSILEQRLKSMLHVGKGLWVLKLSLQADSVNKAVQHYMTVSREPFEFCDKMFPNSSDDDRRAQYLNADKRLLEARESLARKLSEYDPVGSIVQDLKTQPMLPAVAQKLNEIRSIVEEANTTVVNKWTHHMKQDSSPTFALGNNYVDEVTLANAGSNALKDLRMVFLELTINDTELVEAILTPQTPLSNVLRWTNSEDGLNVTLVSEGPIFSKLKTSLEILRRDHPARLVFLVERLRKWLFAAVYTFSTGTLRTDDLGLLRFGHDDATLYGVTLDDGRHTLLVTTIIQKTLVEGYELISPFVARMLVVFLKFISPMCVSLLTERLRLYLPPSSQVLQAFDAAKSQIEARLTIELSTRLGFEAKVWEDIYKRFTAAKHSGSFVNGRLESGDVVLLDLNVIDLSILQRVQPSQIRGALDEFVTSRWLNQHCVTTAQLRSLSANVHVHLLQFARAKFMNGTEEQARLLTELERKHEDLNTEWREVFATGPSSEWFSNCRIVGKKHLRLHDLKFKAHDAILKCMECVFGLSSGDDFGPRQ